MQTLLIERMEPGNPDSLYRAEIGDRKIEGLTYQEAIELMVRTDDKDAKAKCGFFSGTLAEFAEQVKTNGDSKLGQLYRLAIELRKKQIEEEGK